MRPKFCTVSNFGSYQDAQIDFGNLGLTLISGPTGAGKSTIADFACWCLFGQTSKQGAADDVRAWGSSEPTKVVLNVELPNGSITVTRIRGKQTQNDLWWEEAGTDIPVRGKDLSETQKLLEQRLGIDAELYMLGAYFSQFSLTDAFFTARPKDRREVLERITDLSLPVSLAERASEARKLAKKELDALETQISKETGRHEQLLAQKASLDRASQGWQTQRAQQIAEASDKADKFEEEKGKSIDAKAQEMEALAEKIQDPAVFEMETARIVQEQQKLIKVRQKQQKLVAQSADLKAKLTFACQEYQKLLEMPDTCPTCSRPGARPADRDEHLERVRLRQKAIQDTLIGTEDELARANKALAGEYALTKALADTQRAKADNERLGDRVAALEAAIIAEDAALNPFLDRLERLKSSTNPYEGQVSESVKALAAMDGTLKQLEKDRGDKAHRVASLSSIYDLSFALRGELLQSAVSQLERDTNENLSAYFDGVFSIALTLEGADKLQVTVSKEGHEVAYAQLSGGERRQLVLSFWRALSKRAWECAGVSSSLIVMDEAFSGLDDTIKGAAFKLLEDLSEDHESILVIDHSPSFQLNFTNVIHVTKQGENSVLECG